MKPPHSLLRALAVLSSVLLVVAFVGYRGGAFDWLIRTSPEPDDPGSNPPDARNKTPGEEMIFSGSKSGEDEDDTSPAIMSSTKLMVISDAPAKPKPPPTKQSLPTVMSGSKSFFFVPPPDFFDAFSPLLRWIIPDSPQLKRPAAEQRPPTILPSSKSGVIASPELIK